MSDGPMPCPRCGYVFDQRESRPRDFKHVTIGGRIEFSPGKAPSPKLAAATIREFGMTVTASDDYLEAIRKELEK